MPIQLFQIFLDKSEPYLAGEQITGKFVLVISDSYTHNGIFLKFEGQSLIKWTEDSSCFEHTVAKQNRSRRTFFEASFKYSSSTVLPEGTHIFPFEYKLPGSLPSSLNTPTLTIWYKMEAVISKDPKPRREVLVFPVKGTFDPGSEESMTLTSSLARSASQTKSFSLLTFFQPPFFCGLSYASIGIQVKRQAFLPGEFVVVKVAYLTDTEFTFASLSLIQEITVFTKEKTMIERRTLGKLNLPDLRPLETEDYKRWEEVLAVPEDVVVSSNAKEYKDAVTINYFVKFSAEARNFPYKTVKLWLPITIASVPLDVPEHDPSDAEDGESETGETNFMNSNLNTDAADNPIKGQTEILVEPKPVFVMTLDPDQNDEVKGQTQSEKEDAEEPQDQNQDPDHATKYESLILSLENSMIQSSPLKGIRKDLIADQGKTKSPSPSGKRLAFQLDSDSDHRKDELDLKPKFSPSPQKHMTFDPEHDPDLDPEPDFNTTTTAV